MRNRRHFLASSAALLTVSALPSSLRAQRKDDVFASQSLPPYSKAELSLEHFQTLVGLSFTLFLDDGRYAYPTLLSARTLAEVSAELRKSSNIPPEQKKKMAAALPAKAAVNGFQLVFDTAGSTIPQGSYLLHHSRLGRFIAFLVPGTTTCTSIWLI